MKKYSSFITNKIFESILNVDQEFIGILYNMRYNNVIANELYNRINKDIKTNLNYLKVSDKNDEIKFVNDTQVQRMIDNKENPFDRAANIGKIGRSVRQILTANNVNITDEQLVDFVNKYKHAWDRKFNKTSGFQLVSGDDIKYWYDAHNYVQGGGTLNNSCMRYEGSQNWFNIYTKNPEVCQLLIYLNDKNFLLGRALVWKLNSSKFGNQYYLDRVYTRYDSDVQHFKDWFENWQDLKGKPYDRHGNGVFIETSVKIPRYKFDFYPYMDSFRYFYLNEGLLKTTIPNGNRVVFFVFENTNGEFQTPNHKYSKHLDKYIYYNDAVLVYKQYNNLGYDDFFEKIDCVESRQTGGWIQKELAVFSNVYGSYIPKIDSMDSELGIILKDDLITVFDGVDETGKPINQKPYLKSKNNREETYKRISYNHHYYYVRQNLLVYDITRGVDKWTTIQPNNTKKVIITSIRDGDLPFQIERYTNVDDRLIVVSVIWYPFENGRILTYLPIGLRMDSTTYLIRENAGVQVYNLGSKYQIDKSEYYNIYLNSVYKILVDSIQRGIIPLQNKEAKLKEINEAHDFLMATNKRYVELQNAYDKFMNPSASPEGNIIPIGNGITEYRVQYQRIIPNK